MADPIHQFEIHSIVTLGHIGGHEIAFTNSALFMAITVVGIWALLMGGSSARALVPGRLQSIAELSYEFVANLLAWHITLKVFASFVTLLGGLGIAGIAGATLPLALVVALTALELLVAFLQAYVFAILTCIYLNDAIHPGH